MWRILHKKGVLYVVLLCPFNFIFFLHYLTLLLFIPQNRVILKVNSGPGCTNIEILAYIRALGVYCVPGVPNTTNVSQEIDQSYSLFKSIFRLILEVIS